MDQTERRENAYRMGYCHSTYDQHVCGLPADGHTEHECAKAHGLCHTWADEAPREP